MITKKSIDAHKLTDFTARVLQKVGVRVDDARITAKLLVGSDLRGVDSHGVNHLKIYVKGIQKGFINLNSKIEVFSHSPATAIMEGDRGLGFVVGYRAMMEAIDRAKEMGAGFVALRNNTHIGAAASYAMLALEYDMIGITMTQTGPLVEVIPPGARKRAVGTNPISVAIPAGKKPSYVLDMASSIISWGKIELAKMKGVRMPKGWVVDENGGPVTDPSQIKPGIDGLLPLGGTPAMGSYKGFGLGVLVDILCGILSGGKAGLHMVNEGRGICNPSHCFFGALRVDGFFSVDKFKDAMDAMIEAYESLPTLPGVKKIYVAGGYEAEIIQERSANGIPLNPRIIQDLKELSEELGVEFDL
jgi:L-2-hydroxycarboxylate dehydrogenase (NAD+)